MNDWTSAACSAETGYVTGPRMSGLHVLDRIGSGDGFAAGLIHGLLAGHSLSRALRSISCTAGRSLTPPSRSPNSASAPR